MKCHILIGTYTKSDAVSSSWLCYRSY